MSSSTLVFHEWFRKGSEVLGAWLLKPSLLTDSVLCSGGSDKASHSYCLQAGRWRESPHHYSSRQMCSARQAPPGADGGAWELLLLMSCVTESRSYYLSELRPLCPQEDATVREVAGKSKCHVEKHGVKC